ncbi:MAG: hypothetical protein K0V04_19125 [Deltaproteobacteria bacterium]|nr:hypothetical protein [Deltaproteobacteria bacterium]
MPALSEVPAQNEAPTSPSVAPDYTALPPPPEESSPPLDSSRDSWAAEVMQAFEEIQIDPSIDGELRFRMTVCKDGRAKFHVEDDSNITSAGRQAVLRALNTVTIPPPSAPIREHMPAECSKVNFVFTWSPRGIR